MLGLAGEVDVSVSGEGDPLVSIDGGPWVKAGRIGDGQTLAVRLTSAPSPDGTTRTATVLVDGRKAEFIVSTLDTVPDAFSFIDEFGADTAVLVVSGPVAVAGISVPTPIRVSGEGAPEISIDGGPWVTSGEITEGQTVEVRLTSASLPDGQARKATIEIGGRSDEFLVATADGTPDSFWFENRHDAPLATIVGSAPVIVTGLGGSAQVSVTGEGDPQVSVDGGTWAAQATISNGQSLAVRLMSASTDATERLATVRIGDVESPWSVVTGSQSPSAFEFDPATNVAGDTVIASDPAILSDLTLPSTARVSGAGNPQVSVEGGPWGTETPVLNNQAVSVRLTSEPGTDGGTRVATVEVGTRKADFAVTTIDTTPDAFTFVPENDTGTSSLVSSNEVTITGITAPTPVTVSGSGNPQVSVDGGPWAEEATIDNGQRLQLRLTSAGAVSSARTATVSAGGVTSDFIVTTGNNVPDAFAFAPVDNAAGGSLVTSAPVTISGLTLPAVVSVTGGEVSIAGGAWAASGSISDGQTLTARLTAAPGTNGGSRTASVTVGGVTANFAVTTIDTTPAPFGFAAKTGVTLSTLTTSTGVPISGITAPANVTVTGGEISVNGGTWAASGTISNGDSLAVRMTSAATPATDKSATVIVGGVTASWTVTTGTNMPDAFGFASVANAAGGSLVTSPGATITGITLPVPVSVAGEGNPQVSIAGGAWTTSGTVSEGQSVAVRLTSAAGTNGGTRTATVTVGGATADFDVTTIDTTPAAFGFAARTGVALSSLSSSDTVTISGITKPANVTVTGGEVSIAGSSTWVTSGTISSGQTLAVRLTSSASVSTASTATVTVGGVAA
ncbi:hypothetical protein LAZ40_04935, partial [Cereibacter sphaeroides]|uniref:beta strand repeat-containing protein n=2 Tax=Cereibacter sphaeroides TaxID=1063 RepID=UPI001F443A8C